MQWTSVNDLREKYLSFFESKGHLRLPSFPLVPINDKSLLLINSGMAPMKKYFTGEVEPPSHRVTTCQKCIRTPDLERVGHTARHGTYFEMLGNFSFGDYFKEQAIKFIPLFTKTTTKRLKSGIRKSAFPLKKSSASARKTTSGNTAPDLADPAQRFTSTAVKSTAAANPTVSPAATATDTWKSGTTYSRSSITWATALTPSLSIRILIPAWVWSVSLA